MLAVFVKFKLSMMDLQIIPGFMEILWKHYAVVWYFFYNIFMCYFLVILYPFAFNMHLWGLSHFTFLTFVNVHLENWVHFWRAWILLIPKSFSYLQILNSSSFGVSLWYCSKIFYISSRQNLVSSQLPHQQLYPYKNSTASFKSVMCF